MITFGNFAEEVFEDTRDPQNKSFLHTWYMSLDENERVEIWQSELSEPLLERFALDLAQMYKMLIAHTTDDMQWNEEKKRGEKFLLSIVARGEKYGILLPHTGVPITFVQVTFSKR
jgi:hypothetical protein